VRGLGDIPVIGNLFKYRTRSRAKRNLMVFLRPIVVRSKEQNNSISMDRYEYMRAAGSSAQPADNSVLVRNLGAPLLPSLTNGQPPAGDAMATMPPPAPVAPRPGAATGPGTIPPPQRDQQRAVQPSSARYSRPSRNTGRHRRFKSDSS
jgi:general secretion pathway protein D